MKSPGIVSLITLVAFAFIVAVLFVGSGCATAPQINPTEALKAKLAQPRSYETLALRKVKTIHIEMDSGDMVIRNALDPINLGPQDPSTASKFLDAGERVLKAAAVGYFGTQIIKEVNKQTVVEQPEPIIIRETPAE